MPGMSLHNCARCGKLVREGPLCRMCSVLLSQKRARAMGNSPSIYQRLHTVVAAPENARELAAVRDSCDGIAHDSETVIQPARVYRRNEQGEFILAEVQTRTYALPG